MANTKAQWLAEQLITFFKRFMPELDKRYASKDDFYTKAETDAGFLPSTTVLAKANADENITMDADGTLHVGGRIGQFVNGEGNTLGIYYPNSINPQLVDEFSMLVTEASGVKLTRKSLSITTGNKINCTYTGGSKTITVSNSVDNRYTCACMMGGTATIDEASAMEWYVNIVSIKQGGEDIDLTKNQSGNITITLDNPLSSSNLTSVRLYPTQQGFSTLYIGIAGGGTSYGYSAIIGQTNFNASNASTVSGRLNYNKGNSSILAGRHNVNTKQNVSLLGQGHKNTSGPNGVCAVGNFSNITSTTAFVVGGGTDDNTRKNLFEVDTSGNVIINGTDSSGNAAKFKIAVINGNLTATKI